jgi:hypothetical protein
MRLLSGEPEVKDCFWESSHIIAIKLLLFLTVAGAGLVGITRADRRVSNHKKLEDGGAAGPRRRVPVRWRYERMVSWFVAVPQGRWSTVDR